MIGFFRKIRKKLADDNKPLKYMRYAIGEIFLVVIGILIALQINNWNEERKDREKEQDLLQQLKEEYTTNMAQLNQKMVMRNQNIQYSSKLLYFIDYPLTIIEDSIPRYLTLFWATPTFDPIKNDIVNTGKLELIRDQDLNRLLTSWETDVQQLKEEEYKWVEFCQDYIESYLIRKNIKRNQVSSNVTIQGYQVALIDRKQTISVAIGNSKLTIDYRALLKDPELESLVSTSIHSSSFLNLESESLRKRILKILELIDKNLK